MTPDEDDHQRLEHGGELLDAALELAVEVDARDRQLLVERAGLLADLEHLLGGAGEQLGVDERLGEALTLEDLRVGDLETLLVHDVARRVRGRLQRLRQRHTGGEHRREDAAEAFQDRSSRRCP